MQLLKKKVSNYIYCCLASISCSLLLTQIFYECAYWRKKIALLFLYPPNSFNHESSCWLIDKDPKDLVKYTQVE